MKKLDHVPPFSPGVATVGAVGIGIGGKRVGESVAEEYAINIIIGC